MIWKNKKYRDAFIIFGLIGLALRLLFIPISMHSDILWVHMCSSKLAYEGVWDIYRYILDNFSDTMVRQGYNYYTPLSFFIIGGFHCVYKMFFPHYGAWIGGYTKMVATGDYAGYLDLFRVPLGKLSIYITMMKMPYLLFDLLCLVFLMRMFKEEKSRALAFALWMINPVVIFGSYVVGQFDIMIAFFLLLTLFFAAKGKAYAAVFTLACSVLLKPASMVLVLPLALVLGRGIKKTLALLAVFAGTIIAGMLPFYIHTGDFVMSALFPKFLAKGGANFVDTVEFTIGKIVFLAGFVLLFCRIIFLRRERFGMGFQAWRYMLSFILLSYFVVFTPVHYFQWAVPFLIIGVVNGNIPLRLYIAQIMFLFIYAINNRFLSAQLFLPLDPDYFYSLKSLPEFMGQYMYWGAVMRLAKYMFYACSIFIIWKTLFKPEVRNA